MLKQVSNDDNKNRVESYIMLSNSLETDMEREKYEKDITLIVKRMEFIFNDKECQVLNFTDITTYKRLKKEEEKGRLLNTLYTSVHHEMLGPLKANVDIAILLMKNLQN